MSTPCHNWWHMHGAQRVAAAAVAARQSIYYTCECERDLYIFRAAAEAPLPLLPYALPHFPYLPFCLFPLFPSFPVLRVNSTDLCGRARLTNCRAVSSLATPAWTHLTPAPAPYLLPLLTPTTAPLFPLQLLPLPLSLLLPLFSCQTTCRTANALFVFQHDASSSAAAAEAETGAATVAEAVQSRRLLARLVEEAASYFIHGKWHKLHVNCDAATWPAPRLEL